MFECILHTTNKNFALCGHRTIMSPGNEQTYVTTVSISVSPTVSPTASINNLHGKEIGFRRMHTISLSCLFGFLIQQQIFSLYVDFHDFHTLKDYRLVV